MIAGGVARIAGKDAFTANITKTDGIIPLGVYATWGAAGKAADAVITTLRGKCRMQWW